MGGHPGVRIEEVKVRGRAERDGWTSRVRTDRGGKKGGGG